MTNFEIYVIICALFMPILALIFVFPKSGKEKTPPKESVAKSENIDKPQKEEKPVKPKEEKKKILFDPVEYSPEDFKGYLDKKHEIVSKPEEKLENDVGISLEDFISRRRPLVQEEKEASSLDELSPELKAMLMIGILDRKHFK